MSSAPTRSLRSRQHPSPTRMAQGRGTDGHSDAPRRPPPVTVLQVRRCVCRAAAAAALQHHASPRPGLPRLRPVDPPVPGSEPAASERRHLQAQVLSGPGPSESESLRAVTHRHRGSGRRLGSYDHDDTPADSHCRGPRPGPSLNLIRTLLRVTVVRVRVTESRHVMR
jgi:hypothetical protein